MVKKKSKDNLQWLEFSKLQAFPQVSHGVFLRNGGVSAPPFFSLNVGETTGDTPENIEKNLSIIKKHLHLPRLIVAEQIHGNDVVWVSADSPHQILNCDGLITKEKGLGLLIKHADCQAALFYDPTKEVIAAVHAGWKGNVKKIYTKTIASMVLSGCSPSEIIVCISPSLGPDHAEFKNYEKEFPPNFWPFQVRQNYFDLWAIARRELLDCGILETHIQQAPFCSYCNKKDYFSYRREQTTGRNGTVIALKS
jgi:hypothetical protein